LSISKVLYRFCFIAGVASLTGAAGCGGGSGVIIPHPTGNYSNASFKGSYVYQIHGFLADGNDDPYRETGVITADGAGHITSGVDAFGSSAFSGAPVQNAVTGSYTIAGDGTGQILLNSTALGTGFSSSQINLAVTLASTSQAELMEADPFASGAGTAELQDPTAISAAPSGTFVFRLHQEVETPTFGRASQVGFFTFSGGTLSAGSMDQDVLTVGLSSLSLTSGSLNTPTALGAGTGSFTDSTGATTNLLYYIVNSGKFVLLANNSGSVGSGSAEAQSGAVGSGLAGNYVFGGRGDDSSFDAGIATVGQFVGSGATISSGALDSMQDGNYTQQAITFTGAPTTTTSNPSSQGRVQVTLSTGTQVILWMVSPSRAFFLDNGPNGNAAVEDGTADLQTGTSFSAAIVKGQFAIVMDGMDLPPTAAVEGLARVGTLQLDGTSKLTLLEMANASQSGTGATTPGALSGNYQVGGSGRITSQVNNSNGSGPDLVMYGISGSQAYALQTDLGTVTSGTIQLQH